jgi:hypothetical protein
LFRSSAGRQRVRRLPIALLAAVILALPAAVALAASEPPGTGVPPDAAGTPDTRIDSGPAGPTANPSPWFSFSSPQETSRFGCSLDAAPFAACASPQALTQLPDGSHTFRVRAIDASGVADPTPASSTFAVDTTPPDVFIDSGPAGPVNDPVPTFAFSSADASATFACSLGAEPPAFAPCPETGTYQPATPLADGSYDFSVRATDPAGNSATADRQFSVDTHPPEVAVESGPSGTTGDAQPTFTFASPDTSATLSCSIDTGDPSFAPCSGDRSDQAASPLADGSYTFRVQATDPAGNTAVATRSFAVATTDQAAASKTSFKSSAPKPVPAWYMTARGERDLKRQARNDACAFARRQPNRTRVLLLDFGKATRHQGDFGTQLRTGPHFSNQDILHALKAAAHAYRTNGHCYRRGSVRITYGNTNNMPNWMGRRNIRKAGRRQARMAHRLEKYQRAHGRHYKHEGVAVAGDIEPQWNKPKASTSLVSGATFRHRGGLYYNYGAATQCPPETSTCANSWSVRDLGLVSYGGVKRPLPEIYRPVHAKQWTRVRRRWNHRHRAHFCFSGTTATPGFALSGRKGWAELRAMNKCVQHELVSIQEQ